MNDPFLTIEGCRCIPSSPKVYVVIAFGRSDSDGTGPHFGDRTAQNQTSYRPYLNASVDRYVVVPPQFRVQAQGVVLGCKVKVENLNNGKWCWGVVGDVGPHDKWGEMAMATLSMLGINPNPVSGGSNSRNIRYTYYTDVPGIRPDGSLYKLQPCGL